jgi:hypothetical protein
MYTLSVKGGSWQYSPPTKGFGQYLHLVQEKEQASYS